MKRMRGACFIYSRRTEFLSSISVRSKISFWKLIEWALLSQTPIFFFLFSFLLVRLELRIYSFFMILVKLFHFCTFLICRSRCILEQVLFIPWMLEKGQLFFLFFFLTLNALCDNWIQFVLYMLIKNWSVKYSAEKVVFPINETTETHLFKEHEKNYGIL